MKSSHKSFTRSFFAPLAIASIVAIGSALPAAAEPQLPGSYLGAGVSVNAGTGDRTSHVGGNIAGRYKIENAPISLRTSVLMGNGGTSIVPTLSYDLPVGDRTNLFVGAGGSFVASDNDSLTGDRNAFALQPGIEVSLNENVLLYSNAVFALNSHEDGSGTAASVQAGVGFQF